MPLLETILLGLGPSIAKSIIKSWLGDSLQTDLAGDLIDLLKGTGEKAITEREAGPQLDKLGGTIAARMKPLFEHEGKTLDQDQRALLAQEVARTLAKVPITADLIISFKMDSDKLTRHLQQAHLDAIRLFSEKETALYNRMLAEASQSIVSVATQLPEFERVLTAKTLQGQEQILESLAALMARPDDESARFERDYHTIVKRQLDKMEFFGVRQVDTLASRQSLSVAYVTLDVGQAAEARSEHELMVRYTDMLADWIGERDTLRFGPIDRALAASRRLVVQGEAGSGKSTLLQWVAVRSASHDLPPHLSTWNDTVPFFIRLRECVNQRFPAPEDFPLSVARLIIGDMPRGWVHDQLRSGRAVVLIDGVDELPFSQRDKMLDQLKQLVASFPYARYMVTSRPAALKADEWPAWHEWIKQEGFSQVSLQPMNQSSIESFIDKWYEALSRTLGDEQERESLQEHPAGLQQLLRHRPPLRRLATNPLLCAMICALYRDRRQTLPAERLGLYRECVEMLLGRRDEVRHVAQSDYPSLGDSQKLALIQDFAYHLLLNGCSDVSMEEADSYFEGQLPKMNMPDVTGQGVRTFFVERANLLREPVLGRIDFAHRTFQEYLAARAAINAGDINVLLKNSRDDQWREMIILAAGEARPKERERLLKGLIEKGDKLKVERHRHQLYLLAVACLETCLVLDPNVRQHALEKAASVFPPKDEDEAKLVAAAGDPAVPFLALNPQHDEGEAVMCVRSLALMGSDAALSTLAGYASDTRYFVQREIGQAWESFDRRQFAQQVVAHTQTLTLLGLSSWQVLEYLGHLTNLNLQDLEIANLEPLASHQPATAGHQWASGQRPQPAGPPHQPANAAHQWASGPRPQPAGPLHQPANAGHQWASGQRPQPAGPPHQPANAGHH
jgi:hypothetical protein